MTRKAQTRDWSPMNIVVAGPPLSGKSTVGPIVADSLGMDFFDLDLLIEQRCSMNIPMIFREHGEDYFRSIESRLLAETLEGDGLVLAVGGGCLVEPQNLEIALSRSCVVSLLVSEEELISRWQSAKLRPLAPTISAFRLQLDQRRAHYLSLPNLIPADGLSEAEIAALVIRVLEVSDKQDRTR